MERPEVQIDLTQDTAVELQRTPAEYDQAIVEANHEDLGELIEGLIKENTELKAENTEIKEENSDLKTELRSAYKMISGLSKNLARAVRRIDILEEIERVFHRLRFENNRLRSRAHRDEMTGFTRKEYLEPKLEEVLASEPGPLNLIYIDLDGLKTINDENSHTTGDQYLKGFANTLRAQVRQEDLSNIYRVGGDEFVILLPGIERMDAFYMAENIIAHLANEEVETDSGDFHIRMSMGLATIKPGEERVSAQELIGRADHAMYTAKQSGGAQLAEYNTFEAA